jgi:hypothetical protein
VSTTCCGALPRHHHPAATPRGTPTLQKHLLHTARKGPITSPALDDPELSRIPHSRLSGHLCWDKCIRKSTHESMSCRQTCQLDHLLLLCLAAVCVSRPRSPRPADGAVLQRRHHCGSLGPEQLLIRNMLTPGPPRLQGMLQWSTQCSKHHAAIQIRVQSSPGESERQVGRRHFDASFCLRAQMGAVQLG